jgi:hypothetical protein
MRYAPYQQFFNNFPLIYFFGFVGLTDHEMDQLLESHLIDPGSLRFDDFYSFIKARSLALLKIIYCSMGKGEMKTQPITAVAALWSCREKRPDPLDSPR